MHEQGDRRTQLHSVRQEDFLNRHAPDALRAVSEGLPYRLHSSGSEQGAERKVVLFQLLFQKTPEATGEEAAAPVALRHHHARQADEGQRIFWSSSI